MMLTLAIRIFTLATVRVGCCVGVLNTVEVGGGSSRERVGWLLVSVAVNF